MGTIRETLAGMDGGDVAIRSYGAGEYTASLSEDVEPGTYLATFSKEELPHHDVVRFRSIDAAAAYFEAEGMSGGWTVTADE